MEKAVHLELQTHLFACHWHHLTSVVHLNELRIVEARVAEVHVSMALNGMPLLVVALSVYRDELLSLSIGIGVQSSREVLSLKSLERQSTQVVLISNTLISVNHDNEGIFGDGCLDSLVSES